MSKSLEASAGLPIPAIPESTTQVSGSSVTTYKAAIQHALEASGVRAESASVADALLGVLARDRRDELQRSTTIKNALPQGSLTRAALQEIHDDIFGSGANGQRPDSISGSPKAHIDRVLESVSGMLLDERYQVDLQGALSVLRLNAEYKFGRYAQSAGGPGAAAQLSGYMETVALARESLPGFDIPSGEAIIFNSTVQHSLAAYQIDIESKPHQVRHYEGVASQLSMLAENPL